MSDIPVDVRAANLISEINGEASHAEHLQSCVVCAELFATIVKLINKVRLQESCRSILVELKRRSKHDPKLEEVLLEATNHVAKTEGI
jgi:hypothetical protein